MSTGMLVIDQKDALQSVSNTLILTSVPTGLLLATPLCTSYYCLDETMKSYRKELRVLNHVSLKLFWLFNKNGFAFQSHLLMSSSRIARQIKTSLNTQHYPIRSIPRPKLCRRCMSIAAQPPRIAQFSARREPQWPRGGSARSPARLLSTENLKAGWCTDIEAASAKLISAVKLKVDEYRAAMANVCAMGVPNDRR